MSRTEYRFDGLDAQEQQLSRMIEEEYPAEFRAMVIQIARELQGKVKEKTPHKTGRLQDSWKVGPIVKKGDTYYIEVYTNVEYGASGVWAPDAGRAQLCAGQAHDGAVPGGAEPGPARFPAGMAQRLHQHP